MHVNDSSMPFEAGFRYEIILTELDLRLAREKVGMIRPSHRDAPSEWLRWFLDIAEARGQ